MRDFNFLKPLVKTHFLVSFKQIKQTGFSLIEVLGAMMILSISLVALMHNQSSSLQLTRKALYLDRAVSLAEAKMAELTHEANQRGFTEFKEADQGNFEEDSLENFSWRYQTQAVAPPDFAGMAKAALGEEGSDSTDQGNAGMLDGPLKSVTDAWSKALLELRVEILWKEGNSEKIFALVTHLVDQNASVSIGGLVQGISQAAGGGNPQDNSGDQ